jgi:hypothetical protein
MVWAICLTFLLLSSGWSAGYWLFELRQFLARRAAKREQNQVRE